MCGALASKPLTVEPAPNAVVRRYTSDSVKFADAKPSQLADLRKGDQVHAQGRTMRHRMVRR